LTGMCLNMSTSHHPETDGSSKQTNKTVNQCICYHVQRNQKGWVRALPCLHFHIMNAVNASTGFSAFELRMGCSPCVIPPLQDGVTVKGFDEEAAKNLIARINDDEAEAKDCLLVAKLEQAYQANKGCAPDNIYEVGDKVMLSTLNQRRGYKRKDKKCATKFFPRFNGPYTMVKSMPEFSAYKMNMPNQPLTFNTFHLSQLKQFHPNDGELFPSQEHAWPAPVVGLDRMEEYAVETIIDERQRGRRTQYLVRWIGYGPEEYRWLPRHELEDCEALDLWLETLTGRPCAR